MIASTVVEITKPLIVRKQIGSVLEAELIVVVLEAIMSMNCFVLMQRYFMFDTHVQ